MTYQSPPNARFWTWLNGDYVKITLRPGQSLTHYSGGPCEEGWSYEAETWEHDGDYVISTWAMEAKDCDGRIDRLYCCRCKVSELNPGYEYELASTVQAMPHWEDGSSSQRDYAAEAMGY